MSEDLKNKKSDYLLELALEEQLEYDDEMKKYDAEDRGNAEHVFSEDHDKKMKKIFKMAEKAENRPKHALRMKQFKQVAAIFAIMVGISAFTITQVEAFRVPVYRFFREVNDKYTMFKVEGAGNNSLPEEISPLAPKYVPDGYYVTAMSQNDNGFSIEYKNNEKDEMYLFSCNINNSDVALDTENAEVIETEMNGNRLIIIQKDDRLILLMYKGKDQLRVGGSISLEEGLKIMESIK